MASTLDPFIRVVANMMRSFGGDTSMEVNTTTGEYDPEIGGVPTTTTTYQVRAIGFDYVQKNEGLTDANKSMIEVATKQIYIQPKDGVPFPTPKVDYIYYKGIRHSVVAVKEINPTGTKTIFIEVYARQ